MSGDLVRHSRAESNFQPASPPALSRDQCAIVVGDGEFGMHVVGTARHQMALEKIAGGRKNLVAGQFCGALLLPEPENPHDPSAVAVYIDGRRMGSLHRDVAPGFKRALFGRDYAAAGCIARIDRDGGRRGRFGVRLDAFIPFDLRDLEPDEIPPSLPAAGNGVDVDTVPLARRLRAPGRILMLLCACLALGAIGAVGMAAVSEYRQSTNIAQALPPSERTAALVKEPQNKSETPEAVGTVATRTEVAKPVSAAWDMPPNENEVAAYIAPNLEILPAATLPGPADVPQTVRFEAAAEVPFDTATEVPLPRPRPRPRRPETRQAADGGVPDGLNELRRMFLPEAAGEREDSR